MRLSKFIATSGYSSRRQADVLIEDGFVIVNNEVCRDFSKDIVDKDEVIVENTLISLQNPRLWLFYKPKGYLCTNNDPMGRRTIFDILPPKLPRLLSVGRLDLHSEGLLLLTNNGEVSRFFELPRNKIERSYHVNLIGSLSSKDLSIMEKGVSIKGVNYGPINSKVIKKIKNKFTLELTLNEGKNREIRNIAEYFEWKILKLKRIKYGNYHLGDMKEKEVIEVNFKEQNLY